MFLDWEIDRCTRPDDGLDGERSPNGSRPASRQRRRRREEDHGAAGAQSGLDLGSGQPVVQREQDGVGDRRGEEELEDVIAIWQQESDGRLLPGGLTVLDQAVTGATPRYGKHERRSRRT